MTLSSDRDLTGRILDAAGETLARQSDVELLWQEVEWL